MSSKHLVRMLGIALVAVLAVSAVAVASASAHVFVASKTGTISGKQSSGTAGLQKFVTAGGTVECTELTASGTATEPLEKEKQILKVTYKGCKAFGLSATISEAEYEFTAAGNGEAEAGAVKILKPITISAGFGSCEVKVPAPQTFTSGITYNNNKPAAGKIEIATNVKGIESEGKGTCSYNEIGAGKGKGVYTGNSFAELVGGTIEVK